MEKGVESQGKMSGGKKKKKSRGRKKEKRKRVGKREKEEGGRGGRRGLNPPPVTITRPRIKHRSRIWEVRQEKKQVERMMRIEEDDPKERGGRKIDGEEKIEKIRWGTERERREARHRG